MSNLLHHKRKLIRFEGFKQVVARPYFHRFNSRLNGAICRDDDDHRIRIFLLYLFQQLNAVHSRHLDVHKQEFKRKLFQFFQGLNAG